MVLAESERITPDLLPPHVRAGAPVTVQAPKSLHDLEKQAILSALERAGWNKTAAARDLGIPRHVLLYRMKKYRIASPTGTRKSGT